MPQSTLLGELLIDELAAQAGIDALEFRHRNALRRRRRDADRPGAGRERRPARVPRRAAAGLGGGAQRGRATRSTQRAVAAPGLAAPADAARGAGIACMWYGIGNTVIANPSTMRGALRCDAARGAHLFLYNGAQEIGQGTATIMPQMFADAVGLPLACVDQVMGDTDLTADAGKSSASRQTFVSGNAARARRASTLRRQLLERLGWPATATTRDGRAVARRPSPGRRAPARERRRPSASTCRAARPAAMPTAPICFVGSGHFNPPTVPLDADGQGVPYATYGFAAQIAEVEVDLELGTVKLLHIHAAHDVGRAINPTQVEGQIHGGIAQGIGMALMEEYVNGRTDNLHDYLIPTVGDVPPITVHLIEDPEPLGPWGAKGVGEPALVATAPAILNAIHAATGVRMREVPVTPSRLRAAILAPAAA